MVGIVVVNLIIVGLTSIDVSTGSPINKGDAARFPGKSNYGNTGAYPRIIGTSSEYK